MFYLTLIICFMTSILITPFIKKLAFLIGATDKPEQRKVHQKIMPRIGGLSIFISFIIGVLIIHPTESNHQAILIGSFIIIFIGLLDDIKDLPPVIKLAGQIVAAFIVVYMGDMNVDFINLPFGGKINFGPLSIPLTMIWIIAITNAINLIDGLDGLAAGVSSIALLTIAAMAAVMGNTYVIIIALIVAASTLGFLVFNFYPAKIFMGDVGSQFLGYIIGVLSILGFKNVTFISLIIPIIILGVPISDTFFAIIRRLVNRKPISAPDKSHLHHCLLKTGFTHRQTVILIYAMSIICGLAAFIFSQATEWGALIVIAILVIVIEIFVEKIGLVKEDYQPLLKFIKGIKQPIKLKNKY
ncbi:glycosyltransferase family 4 protein [Neobacillus massiliamazoniensis]|uniref:Glycosyl transferase family 4 n=1 Tax=Neobacillus massiliamazoniensis TaxID=1499688 RepID=A0A0U1NUF0_9BACI|nr:MraY family glycosyltransferase [Neobacillus massiliamazoniensis]CRK81378.1 glycosyl transferase family 4 [Neobacillus massiliamazoniensis]